MKTHKHPDSQMKKLVMRHNIVMIALLLCLGYIIYGSLFKSDNDILYAKGIVIVDEEGKERILIGAPIPKSKDRIRDDLDKAKKVWGEELELNKEWDWFEEMNHDCVGMLVLDENGHDRLAMGSPTPDPNIGIRIGPATGIEINDEKGYERSGYALMPVNGGNRVALGIDNPGSEEGAVFSMLEDGTVGLSVYDSMKKKGLFIGKSEAKSYYTPGEEAYFGMALRDSLGVEIREKQ